MGLCQICNSDDQSVCIDCYDELKVELSILKSSMTKYIRKFGELKEKFQNMEKVLNDGKEQKTKRG